MTPEERAKDIVVKHLRVSNDTKEWFSTPIAKHCAKVTVDEILNTIEYSSQADEMAKIIYWQKVKQEIEKL